MEWSNHMNNYEKLYQNESLADYWLQDEKKHIKKEQPKINMEAFEKPYPQ